MNNTPSTEALNWRREKVFLLLAGFFLCAMTLLNVIGITRFIQLGPMALAVGVLPYPLTFLCTDLVSELYGKKRANFMVTVGLIMNLFVIAILWLGSLAPSVGAESMPPWQQLNLSSDVILPDGTVVAGTIELYQLIFACTSGAVVASMLAYMAAQYCDVYLFHFWKRLTRGKHLWLRNNLSTLVSQGVDSFTVITVTFGAAYLAGGISLNQLLVLMGSNYLFKMVVALADTLPLYAAVHYLRRYLHIKDDTHIAL
ncbi:queuosine precursor transporter [Simiduia sp. 21SJ11W-1]|uniref:queuosine precursor transporter n=1 Tax=Simiduia sp. 21SJ11W-1 TaxID=2909669 RepID=UPI0020A0389F|nr:queuosine precursor transporter [Simiduia sp. 21SJ11W-1]UTA46417.1 queuosine precursor transporter [Simiduia sp. 21SJ11W-1]